MKRIKNKEYLDCPICGKKPFVKITDNKYGKSGKVWCRGSLINKHKEIYGNTDFNYFHSENKVHRALSCWWNKQGNSKLKDLPIACLVGDKCKVNGTNKEFFG